MYILHKFISERICRFIPRQQKHIRKKKNITGIVLPQMASFAIQTKDQRKMKFSRALQNKRTRNKTVQWLKDPSVKKLTCEKHINRGKRGANTPSPQKKNDEFEISQIASFVNQPPCLCLSPLLYSYSLQQNIDYPKLLTETSFNRRRFSTHLISRYAENLILKFQPIGI